MCDTNFKRKKVGFVQAVFFDFCKFMSLTAAKTGVVHFPGKRAPTKLKYLPPVFQILLNFTEGNPRKFIVSFAFCAHVDVIKHSNTLVILRARRLLT